MKKLIIGFTLLFCYATSVLTQAPTWSTSLGNIGFNQINYIKKAGTSTVLICTNNKIFGVSAKDKKIIWESQNFTNLNDSTLKVHAGKPYITITGKSTFGLKREYTILNSETGEIVFNNQTENGKASEEVFLQKKNAFLVFGREGKGGFASFRSLETGKETWKKSFNKEEANGKGLLGNIMSLAGTLTGFFMLESEANNDVSENIVLHTSNLIFCLDGNNGNELWRKDFGKMLSYAIRSDDGKYLFVQYSGNKFNYLDMATGKEMLANPLKFKFYITKATKLNGGYMLLTDKGFNILQDDGTLKFDKNVGRDVRTSEVWKLDDGYILASDPNELIRNSSEEAKTKYGKLDILKVNENGDKLWTKSFGFNGKMFMIKSGLFVFNDNMADLYNYTDGGSMWEGKIRLQGETTFGYDRDSASVIAYSKGKIERFNLADGSYKNIISDFKFKEKLADNDQVFVSAIKEGVFMNSNQNYALVNYDGTVIYNKTLVDASGVSRRLKKGILLVSGIVELVGAVKMESAKYDYAKGIKDGTMTNEQAQRLEERYKKGDKILSIGKVGEGAYDFLNSFDKKGTLSWQTYTTLTNTGSGISAVVIDKATGNEKKRVKINDKNPITYVDDVTNTLYIVTTLLELKVFDLN